MSDLSADRIRVIGLTPVMLMLAAFGPMVLFGAITDMHGLTRWLMGGIFALFATPPILWLLVKAYWVMWRP